MAATVYERDNWDGDGCEMSLEKWILAASIFFTLIPSRSIRQILAKFFWSWILKDCIEIHEKEWKVVVLCSRHSQNVGANSNNNDNNNICIFFIFIKYMDKPLNVWEKKVIIIDNVLTIKILFTINSLWKKTISSKHYLQFLSLKKNT